MPARTKAVRSKGVRVVEHPGTGVELSTWTVLSVLLLARVLQSAVSLFVSDCDEAFNYWEPTHYLIYGTGFQTWEYRLCSPEFAIRSWSYPLLHAVVGNFVASVVGHDAKATVYFGIRAFLALLCALCECVFIRGARARFGNGVANRVLLFLLLSPGMFIAASSFLPSSFAMYGVLLAYGCWFLRKYALAVTAAAAATIIPATAYRFMLMLEAACWPFVGIVFSTIAIDVIVQTSFAQFMFWSLMCLAYFLAPALAIDYVYYNKLVAPVLNIVLYNYTTKHEGGAQLYGEEPWHFYLLNLALNFNVLLPLFFIALPLLKRFTLFLYFTPALLWFFLMIIRPHKEERFLFVIYPLICLMAAVGGAAFLSFIRFIVERLASPTAGTQTSRAATRVVNVIGAIFCITFVVLSASRCGALVDNYSASARVFGQFTEHATTVDNERNGTDAKQDEP